MLSQVDTSNPGLIGADQLRPLMQYLNFDLPPELEASELRFLAKASGSNRRLQDGYAMV